VIDLQVVFPQEAIDLTRVRLLPGSIRSVDVMGTDFSSVDDVLINDIRSPDVVVVSRNRLVAQVPDEIPGDRVLSVTVLSKRLTVTPRSLLRFRISRVPGKVSGLQRLIQLFLKVLFTTPGSDIFHKRLGAGALGSVGTYHNKEVVNNFIVAVDQAARQVVALQGRRADIPRDERLLNAKVIRTGFNPETASLDVTVEIMSQAGSTALANVGV
jgi:hypothetical protein